jgi:serine protease Do
VRRGQVILMINNQPVGGMDDFNALVEALLESGRTVALLLQRSDGNRRRSWPIRRTEIRD